MARREKEQIWDISYLLTCKQGKYGKTLRFNKAGMMVLLVCILIFYMIEICQKNYGEKYGILYKR